jgi:hypothetical protein
LNEAKGQPNADSIISHIAPFHLAPAEKMLGHFDPQSNNETSERIPQQTVLGGNAPIRQNAEYSKPESMKQAV